MNLIFIIQNMIIINIKILIRQKKLDYKKIYIYINNYYFLKKKNLKKLLEKFILIE